MVVGTKTSFCTRKIAGGSFNVEDQGLSTGDRYFVDSGATNGANTLNGGYNPDMAFLTLDYAIGKSALKAK